MGHEYESKKKEKRRKWARHIEDWRESGKSQAQYCREQGLSSKLFYYWKNKHNDNRSNDGVKLVPVEMQPIRIHTSEIITSSLMLQVGQYKVEIGNRFDSSTLARLLNTLEHI